MEHINAADLSTSELNKKIIQGLKAGGEVSIQNPHSMHNIATGLSRPGTVTIQGSTGFYTGGFLEGSTVIIEGNAGWYVGDNMMDGELLIRKNTGCNAGTYLSGGTVVIYGSTGSRVGYGMKGGTIIVCGSVGAWAGQMTLGGKLIVLGKLGADIGESMYRGAIFVRDKDAEKKLGSNVFLDHIQAGEARELEELFKRYGIDAKSEAFQVIRPLPSGRHSYALFNPELKPELAQKMRS